MHPPNPPKDPLLATKWGFYMRDKGVRFKKVHLFGACTPPQIDPGYGPGKIISLSAIRGWGALRCYGVHMNITRKTDH